MFVAPPPPSKVMPCSARARCNFARPPGVPYKYPVGGIVIDDELMAIDSTIYSLSIPFCFSQTFAFSLLWDTLDLLRAIS